MSPPIPSGVTLAALARDEGDGSSRGSNDESEVSGSNLAEEMTVVRARENLYKQSGKMGLNGKKIKILGDDHSYGCRHFTFFKKKRREK